MTMNITIFCDVTSCGLVEIAIFFSEERIASVIGMAFQPWRWGQYASPKAFQFHLPVERILR